VSAPTLAQAHDVALLDLDGVVYAGAAAVPHAVAALTAASQAGMRLAYVTNNASRVPSAVAEHLRELGLPAEADDVVTSAQAGAGVVAGLVPPGAWCWREGRACRRARRTWAGGDVVGDDDPAAVLQGYDPALAWPLLAEGAFALAGIPWVATTPT
jgi:ribonucleotide monophosphatase NagD (HAD superfamily)